MVANEGRLLGHFERTIPSSLARGLLLDLALLKYHSVSAKMSDVRLRELSAMAQGFQPDPYSGFFDTFQRFVYLNALYDISLSFEHSPLIGCTTFVLNADADGQAEPLLARNFDFEVDPIFDHNKAVFFVQENGKIPFASVAWPGLVGVVSGMNAQGVALVVHGARAGTPSNQGEPVVHALRRVLSNAVTTEQALQQLGQRAPMVSHMVVVMDQSGRTVVVERAPGHPNHARRLPAHAGVTNHFEGNLKTDPKNIAVRRSTSTLQRLARADELLRASQRPFDAQKAIGLLRDRRGPGGQPLTLGDREAIDALIATHAVVMNPRKRQLWVSEGPHLLGRFLRFDLPSVFNGGDRAPLEVIAADPALKTDEVQRFLTAERAGDRWSKQP
jgi:hypothetical protein